METTLNSANLPSTIDLNYLLSQGETFLKSKQKEHRTYREYLDTLFRIQIEENPDLDNKKSHSKFVGEKYANFAEKQIKEVKLFQKAVIDALKENVENKNDLLSPETQSLLKIAHATQKWLNDLKKS
jgi:hypothetical protein